jgi:hypothetical protein
VVAPTIVGELSSAVTDAEFVLDGTAELTAAAGGIESLTITPAVTESSCRSSSIMHWG